MIQISKIKFIISTTLLIICALSCAQNEDVDPLKNVLKSSHPKIKKVMDHLEEHEVQILFTEVLKVDDSVVFKDFEFQVNDNTYFYPASTVKFPMTVLALEKMNSEQLYDRNTIYTVGADSVRSTFSEDIKKIYAVSDNEAYTRLFEFLGKDEINNRLSSKGITARISHRLSGTNPNDLATAALHFRSGDNIITYKSANENSIIEPLKLHNVLKGVGYIENGELVNRPKDFSKKNYLPISALHGMMKRLMFPEKFEIKQRFNLSPSDREFLINTMKIFPKDAGYDRDTYYDGYVKFFIYGDSKEDINADITFYNKVGYAYGYLTDCAYIINNLTQKHYILTATIKVNKNQIYNDDNYEYDAIGIPFLAELGRQLVLEVPK